MKKKSKKTQIINIKNGKDDIIMYFSGFKLLKEDIINYIVINLNFDKFPQI